MNLDRCFQSISVFLLQLSIVYFAEAVTNITTDYSALLYLKNMISFDPDGFLKTWNESAAVCSWKGVTCSSRDGRVIALDISHNRLSGVIPKEIGNLTMLKMLNLEYNNFTGFLPDEIGELKNMENISISHNSITGTIPRRIGNCTSLKEINFNANHFVGNIPQEIGSLRQLEILRIRDNYLTGNIPSELFNISTLKVILAQSNMLSGGLPLKPGLLLPNLEELYFGGNSLNGSLPPSISNASKLTCLDLSLNFFSGSFPATLGDLRFLRVLNLDINNMTSGESPESSFLSSLTNCRNLSKLVLSGNSLNDTLVSIRNFSTTLIEFSASNCNLKGYIPSEIQNLTNLISLRLGNNELVGAIPAEIGRLKKLQGLSLQGNHLDGTVPNNLCDLYSLVELNLGGNKLVGPIPECLGDLTSLMLFDLSSNKLNSSIPSSLWSNFYVLYINISSNFLSGTLPSRIKSKVAVEIDLSNNRFSDGILDCFVGLNNLVFLSVANNAFTGTIPKNLGENLEFLDLSGNNLFGVIPNSLEKLVYLTYFNASFNQLEGEIPDEGPFRNFSARSYIGNKALCGAQRLQVPPCESQRLQVPPCESPRPEKPKKGFHPNHLFLRLVPVIAVATIATSSFACFRKFQTKNNEQVWELTNIPAIERFSILELRHATDAFSEGNLLGRGSFCLIYRGTLLDGKVAAIKVFNVEDETALNSFEVERNLMHNTCHRNLSRILFSISNSKFKALVMEYMSSGTLEKWLHTHNYHLDLHRRLDIMIDTASAVKYFHYDYKFPIVHCDLKPSNILLDEDMIAHVSDFGSAKLLDPKLQNSSRHSTIMYTIGYAAPEYGVYGNVSTKTDVYSFGILLMETFTGKKPTNEMFFEELSLRNWVLKSFPNEVEKVADPSLMETRVVADPSLMETREGQLDVIIECIACVMKLALSCSSESPLQRPDMKEVEFTLNRIKNELIKSISRDKYARVKTII